MKIQKTRKILVFMIVMGSLWSCSKAPNPLNRVSKVDTPKVPQIRINSISPNSGTTAGGTSVTITGAGFMPGAVVKMGGILCNSVGVVSSSHITCNTPASALGIKDVQVTNPSLATATLVNGFTYVLPPATMKANGGVLSGAGISSGATLRLTGNTGQSTTQTSRTVGNYKFQGGVIGIMTP